MGAAEKKKQPTKQFRTAAVNTFPLTRYDKTVVELWQ